MQVDPKRLAFFELSLSDVVVAVARENRNVPAAAKSRSADSNTWSASRRKCGCRPRSRIS